MRTAGVVASRCGSPVLSDFKCKQHTVTVVDLANQVDIITRAEKKQIDLLLPIHIRSLLYLNKEILCRIHTAVVDIRACARELPLLRLDSADRRRKLLEYQLPLVVFLCEDTAV